MRTLFFLSALLAAALCATIFPDMKKLLLLIPFALAALALGGCVSATLQNKIAKLPDGHFDEFSLVETDKIGSTTISGKGLDKTGGKFSADELHFDHGDPWVTKLAFDGKGYRVGAEAPAPAKPAVPIIPNPAP